MGHVQPAGNLHEVCFQEAGGQTARNCPFLTGCFIANVSAPTSATLKWCSVQIFKWEKRKGWDVLLSAFLTQFTAEDGVVLYMKTTSFLSDSKFGDHMQQWVSEHLQISGGVIMDNLPTVYVIDENMSQEKLRSLYASVDCFVLPSR